MINPEKVIEISRPDYKNANILAFITDKCNYNCSYCYVKDKGNMEIDMNSLKRFSCAYHDLSEKPVDIDLIGGEPLLHSGLLDLCEAFSNDNEYRICIYTNLSKDIGFLKQLYCCGVRFEATWHSIREDVLNSQFVRKVECLGPDAFRTVTVMFERGNTKSSVDIFNRLVSNGFNVDLQPVIIESGLDKYSEDEFRLFKQTEEQNSINEDKPFLVVSRDGSSEYITHNQIFEMFGYNFRWWKCNAGLDLLYIDLYGNVYPCDGCFNDGEEPMMNICDQEYSLQLKCQICRSKHCPHQDNLEKTRVFV